MVAYVDRETLPRHDGGVDWGVARIVLVRDGRARKFLFWRKAYSSWGGTLSGYTPEPGALILLDRDARDVLGTDLYNDGGRLSAKLVARFDAEIRKFFGRPGMPAVGIKRTMVLL